GDNVVLTQMEHHSSLVPWQQVASRTGAELRFVEVEDGVVTERAVDEAIDEDTAAVSMVHVSNVFGTETPVEYAVERAHEVGARVLVDGAQSAPNMPVDVSDVGCDFFVFSGHKACGPTGTGALYGQRDVLEGMEPFVYGGEMISRVEYTSADWADLPWKFEAGTPNVAGAIGLAEALRYLEDVGLEAISDHERSVARYAVERMEDDPEIEVYGPPADHPLRGGVVSFNVSDAHSHDTSDLLNREGVATRSGHHCAQPLMDLMGVPSTSRASFYLYNSVDDADRLLDAIEVVKEVFA
ncbi:MAG: cysteine desulfurase, partial [Halobacteriota archaeon]